MFQHHKPGVIKGLRQVIPEGNANKLMNEIEVKESQLHLQMGNTIQRKSANDAKLFKQKSHLSRKS